jgi:hypothetical protein
MAAERFANTFDDLLNGQFSAPTAGAPPAPQAAAAPAAMAAPASAPAKKAPIRKQRRRLSVVGDTPEIDGRRSSAIGGECVGRMVAIFSFSLCISLAFNFSVFLSKANAVLPLIGNPPPPPLPPSLFCSSAAFSNQNALHDA